MVDVKIDADPFSLDPHPFDKKEPSKIDTLENRISELESFTHEVSTYLHELQDRLLASEETVQRLKFLLCIGRQPRRALEIWASE